tara:strand:+ start:177 stop:1787 length:1611 start_codon:yes stop_codon:yes gene_type:complete
MTNDSFHHSVFFNTTLAKVTVHTFDHGDLPAFDTSGVSVGQRMFVFGAPPLIGPVQAFHTEKRLGEPTGSWSVTLKGHVIGGEHSGKPWTSMVTDGDWVSINVTKNGQELHIMCGRVDTVATGMTAVGGAPVVTVTLSGRDVGAIPEDVPVYFNPYDPLHSNVSGVAMVRLMGPEAKISGTPSDLVPDLLLRFLKDGGVTGTQATLPAGVTSLLSEPWADAVNEFEYVQANLRGHAHAASILSPGRTLRAWDFADAWRNPLLNEMYLDTQVQDIAPDPFRFIFLTLREKPFVNSTDGKDSPWFDLETHQIDTGALTGVNLTKGQNRVNHVFVLGEVPSAQGRDAMPYYPPVMNMESIGRWGLRQLEERSPFMTLPDDGDMGGFSEEGKEWRDLVVSWNVLNADYHMGTLSLAHMRPEIRVGQKAVIVNGPPAGYEAFPADGGDETLGLSFYVEGVSHDWTDGEQPQATTQLMVSRGYPENERVGAVAAEVDKYAEIQAVNPPASVDESPLAPTAVGEIEIGDEPQITTITEEITVT